MLKLNLNIKSYDKIMNEIETDAKKVTGPKKDHYNKKIHIFDPINVKLAKLPEHQLDSVKIADF